MSKSFKSDKNTKAPSRFFTPQEEYNRGLRRRPKGSSFFDLEDEDDLIETENSLVETKEE